MLFVCFWLEMFQVSDFSKRRLPSCVTIGCTRHAGAGSTRDQRFSFRKDPHKRALWLAAITTEGLRTKNKKDGRVLGCHFLLGKPFSDGSHPDFAPCIAIVHASANCKLPAVSLAGRLGQFKLSVGHYPIENYRLGIALPELYL